MTAASELAERDASASRPAWLILLAVWVAAAVVLLLRAQVQPTPLFGDADDAMRIIEATDLLNGQAWQDYSQYRDNTPYGAVMHWSRLIDAPILVIMAIVTPIAGAAAPRVAGMIWPILLLLPMLALSLAVTRRLVPATDLATPLVLPLVSIVLLVEFIPGRVDHHNVQIILCLVMALCLLLARERVAGGMIAGIAAATSLAIGMETLPVLAVVTTALVVLWTGDATRYWRTVVGYGAGCAVTSLAHFLLATAPENYIVAACDALSIVYVVPAMIGGGLLAGGAWYGQRLRTPVARLAMMAALGMIAVGVTALLFPQCLSGPYAGVKAAMPHYFDDIGEALPLLQRTAADPAIGISFALAVLVAIPVTALRVWQEAGERRTDWAIILALLVVSAIVMMLQIRGARIAAPFAIPAAAWMISEARRRYLAKGSPGTALRLVGTWLLFAGVAHYAVVVTIAPSQVIRAGEALALDEGTRRLSCVDDDAYKKLSALPQGGVMVPFRLGPHVLVNTDHSVVATGFHRNVQGMLATEAFFAGDEDEARRIASERELNYVVLCPMVPEYDLPVGPAPGAHWDWLLPLTGPAETLQIYEVAS